MKKPSFLKFGLPLGVAAGVASLPASAAGLADLTASVDFSDVTTGILAVAAALASVYVIFKGAKIIMSALKGGL